MAKGKGQKDKQWYAKLCTENWRSSYTNLQKNGVINIWCFGRGGSSGSACALFLWVQIRW